MSGRSDAALIAALERSRVHPLWGRYKRITPVAPKAKDAPMHWVDPGTGATEIVAYQGDRPRNAGYAASRLAAHQVFPVGTPSITR